MLKDWNYLDLPYKYLNGSMGGNMNQILDIVEVDLLDNLAQYEKYEANVIY